MKCINKYKIKMIYKKESMNYKSNQVSYIYKINNYKKLYKKYFKINKIKIVIKVK